MRYLESFVNNNLSICIKEKPCIINLAIYITGIRLFNNNACIKEMPRRIDYFSYILGVRLFSVEIIIVQVASPFTN